ncbi:MAG: HEPN domain-containing protein, partial [Gemmatimonadota bacterium]|nr:HEPN domain-containing protein [Gemmatimonadota bacterium]
MIQSSAANPGILDQIVALLVTRFHPIRIFLFGSRARGDFRSDSDYDLLLEIERLPEGVSITGDHVTSLDDFPDTEVQLHLRSPGQLELKQDDPGTIDWDVAREGQLLYSITEPSRADARRVREPRHTPPDSLESWLRFARRDLMHARHHLDDELEDWSDEICFYAQQSAEKIIKALIVSARQRP